MPKKRKELMLSFLENMSLEKVEAYVNRGRSYAHLSTDEVKTLWANTFKVYALDPAMADARAKSDDLEAELTIRKEDLPMELVEAEWKQLQKTLDQAIKDLKRDPKRHKEANEEIAKEVLDFFESADYKAKN